MRVPARLAALLLLAACGGSGGPSENRQVPPAAAAPRQAPRPVKEAPAPAPDSPADLAGLSPSQRRAYERGLADCRAGRYDPDRYPEAYRIGCAAANDR